MKLFSRDPYDDEPGGLRRRLADLPSGVRWGALAAALIAVIFIGWLGFEGLAAKSNLEQARTSAEQSKDALLSGKSEDATRFAENAQFHARQARAATHSLPWNIAAAVPLLGQPVEDHPADLRCRRRPGGRRAASRRHDGGWLVAGQVDRRHPLGPEASARRATSPQRVGGRRSQTRRRSPGDLQSRLRVADQRCAIATAGPDVQARATAGQHLASPPNWRRRCWAPTARAPI